MKAILIGISVRILTNIQQFSDWLYFAGRDFFEICLMFALIKCVQIGWLKDVLWFCIGLAAYNIVKPLFTSVEKHDYMEYAGFIVGALIIWFNYIKKYLNDRPR